MSTVSFRTELTYHGDRKIYVNLDANQPLNPYTWKAPIEWEGYLGGIPIKFVQISNLAHSLKAFDWTGFPEEYDYLCPIIVKEIDKALSIMD